MNEIVIRLEAEADYRICEELTREAFWNNFQPGCDEHFLLHKMRSHVDFIPELTFVALLNGIIVGHIAYTKSYIVGSSGAIVDTVTFGPISVSPQHHRHGIGRKLIEHSAAIATQMGYSAILIFGDPRFYGRVGFRWAERYDIQTSFGKYSCALMTRPLQDGAVEQLQALGGGIFHESEAFELDLQTGLEDYDATFPVREKVENTQSQIDFNVLKSVGYPARTSNK